MKKVLFIALILLLSISLFGCTGSGTQAKLINDGQVKDGQKQVGEADEKAVADLVGSFGSKLQAVSLLAPEDVLKKSMQENYGSLVSPALIDKWVSDPTNAPGRLTSSPWPDRIDILDISKLAEHSYVVKGEIIEITSVEKEKGGVAAKRPVTLIVKKLDNKWLIDDVSLSVYEQSGAVSYNNTKYGFDFSLPDSWKGFKIVTSKWEGLSIGNSQGEKVVEKGPIISIRHPEWTAEKPRQDIPIMVFTLDQWNSLQQEKFHIGAAPIGPSELGRNVKYVFALPARYNFAFPAGYEEVENILKDNPLKPIQK